MTRSRFIRVLIAFSLTAILTGCTGFSPEFTASTTDYTTSTAPSAIDGTDISRISSRPVEDADELRHDALSALRSEGEDAAAAATLITRTFPAGTKSVPVKVERASFEGKPAWIVVEAIDDGSGTLAARRLWVIGDEGNVLFAAGR